jgi:hypothetical protein
MGALVFLAIPVVICLVWLSITAVRHRTPSRYDSSVEDFRREMRALAPDDERRRS